MARHARLYRLIELLRARRTTVTVAALAARLEVSPRTIMRDLDVLRDEGVPIEAEVGRGGGLRLGREYAMPPLALTVDEGIALWLSIEAARRLDVPLLPGIDAARDKVLSALPRRERDAVRALAARIVVGRAASAAVTRSVKATNTGVLRDVALAFARARVLHFRYTDASGRASRRRAAVHGLLLQSPAWYLLAVDVDKDAPRMFRVDRVRGAAIDDDEPFLPREPRALFPELALVGEDRS